MVDAKRDEEEASVNYDQLIVPKGMFGPENMDYLMEAILRAIAVHFGEPGSWPEKYGTAVETDVFMMRPECWCDKEDCKKCSGDMPNFVHKKNGLKVTWYKYIGRSMEYENHNMSIYEIAGMFLECLNSRRI